jgi:predicted dehydrogenase
MQDNREIPDTLEVMWTYPGNTLVTFSQYNASAGPASLPGTEIEFRGTKGTLYLRGSGYEVVPDVIVVNDFPARTPVDRAYEKTYRVGAKPVIEPKKVTNGDADTKHHARNFLDCVKTRETCHCDIEIGHRDTSAALIGNIAHKMKAYLEWDATKEQFTNSEAANKYLRYEYRAPYKLPT